MPDDLSDRLRSGGFGMIIPRQELAWDTYRRLSILNRVERELNLAFYILELRMKESQRKLEISVRDSESSRASFQK